jgi:cytoskeletal protein CcmA (bactofilin family)
MSVFRNNPKPGDKEPEASRFGEPLLSRPDVSTGRQEQATVLESPPEEPRTSFSPFTDRETKPTATPSEKCANVIAAGSKWSGTLNIEDSVRIEGQLSGEVVAKGTVHIGEGARVEAKVRAAFVVVAGNFKGEVRCDERLELTPKGRVEGDIVTKSLTISEGATIDGSIQMTAPKDRSRNGDEATDQAPAPIREARNSKALSS